MKQLNKIQLIIYLLGATLMAIGAGISILGWWIAPYVYCVGALCFASMQMLQRYEGTNFTIRRLRRIMLTSDVLFMLAGVLMLSNGHNVFGLSYITYMEYVYNKWIVVLLIAAILQLYSMHRLDQELAKEAKKL
ncbi:MAG: hypothetical protein IKM77_08105 [Prevotella sp.]|jgi:hypothetical protein|nr:hypothetical protein [Prevotella sp.]